MWAHVLAVGLFIDEPHVVFSSVFALMQTIAIPFLISCAMLFTTYEISFKNFQLLTVNQPAVLAIPGDGAAEITAPASIKVDSPPVHSLNPVEVSWRILPVAPGFAEIKIKVGNEKITRRVFVRELQGGVIGDLHLGLGKAPL